MFFQKLTTKEPQQTLFRDELLDIDRIRLENCETEIYNEPLIMEKINQLVLLEFTSPLNVLAAQKEENSQFLKMKWFAPFEIQQTLRTEELNQIKSLIEKAGGILSLKIFVYYLLLNNKDLDHHSIFYFIQGCIFLYLKIALESPECQLAVFKRCRKSDSQKQDVDVQRWIEDHIDIVLLGQHVFSSYVLNYQNYGNGIIKIQEQIGSNQFDFESQRAVLYLASKKDNTKKLEVATTFRLMEERKKLYCLKMKCIKYYSRTNSLIVVSEMSSVVSFYSVHLQKFTGSFSLENVIPSATSMIVDILVEESEHCLFISTTDRSVFVVDLDPERSNKPENLQKVAVNSKTHLFFSPEIMINMMYIGGKNDILVSITQQNNLVFWSGIMKENKKAYEVRVQPRLSRYSKFQGKLCPNTLKGIANLGWVIVCDTNRSLLIIDPMKCELIMQADCSVSMHSVICDPVNYKIILFGHEKVYWIYETSTYYQEVRSVCHHKAHVAVIIAAEQIPNRKLFITCDESNLVKSWDLDTLDCIQTFSIPRSTPITGLEPLEFTGFIIKSNLIYFMIFDDHHDNYSSILKQIELKEEKAKVGDRIWVVPKLIVNDFSRFAQSFFMATSSEIRSFQFEDGMVDFIYETSKILTTNKKPLITSFDLVRSPCQAVAYGLSNGTVILNPINVEEPSKIPFFEPQEQSDVEGLLKIVISNPK